MAFTWLYTESAISDLKQLDRIVSVRIVKKIAMFCALPDPFVVARPLQGQWKGLWRFRVGDYRIVFRKDLSRQLTLLLILRVKHRREVYD